jgi:hypothetical protein
MQDWKGNRTFLNQNKKNKYESREKDDFYATHPDSVKAFLKCYGPLSHKVYECACGEGHISKVLENLNYEVMSTDLVNRGYGTQCDFFVMCKTDVAERDIITNPPYRLATEFCKHALEIVDSGHSVIMYLPLTFLESKERYQLFLQWPLHSIYVHSSRQGCGKGGGEFVNGGARAYAWFVWKENYKGESILKWIPPF